MRATEISAGRRGGKADRAPEANRFSDALRAARSRMIEAGGAQQSDGRASRADAPRRATPERRPTTARDPAGTGEDWAAPPAAAPTSSAALARTSPEVASIVRALPVAIAAASAAGDGALALSFGRSLDVELRVGRGGVEVVLRPEPRLFAAVSAELPRILAALRARGVSVGSAEVRGRGREPRGRRAR